MGLIDGATIKFIEKSGAQKEVIKRLLAGLIEGVQRMIPVAIRNHPYTTRTGTNDRSIGWAASKDGQTSYGLLNTDTPRARDAAGRFLAGSGNDTSGVKAPASISVILATSSGYGGWLEVKHGAYLIPAVNNGIDGLNDALTGVINTPQPDRT